jgi:3',5'-cyclic-AMP phosphodiesterase
LPRAAGKIFPTEFAKYRHKQLNHLTKSTLNLVHLTDPHLFADPARLLRGVPTLAALRTTLDAATADIAACDALLVTGDLVQDDPGGYAAFRREMSGLRKPVLCIPGNHDDVPAMRAALALPPFQLGGVYDKAGWRTVLLDSTIPGETGGALSADALRFLDDALAAAPDRHALIALHHHPISMQSRWLDTVGLANPNAFFAVLQRHSNVRGIIFGHVHQEVDVMHGKLRVLATPSTCSQFLPRSDDFAIDDLPPAWRVLRLHSDGEIETHLEWAAPVRQQTLAAL